MPEFTYEALDKGGKQVKGITEASSEEALIEKLRNMSRSFSKRRLRRSRRKLKPVAR
jgi:type II secretory pathway component PulF